MSFVSLITQPVVKSAETVQLFAVNGDKVLLVHERAEDGPVSKENYAIGNKPAGWGLPGGGVDEGRAEQDLLEQIFRFLPVYRIDERDFLSMTYNQEIELKLYLTAVKEGIEETGLLIHPTNILLEDPNSASHKVIIIRGEVVAGEIQKRSVETDGCAWFPFASLPHGIYHSHVRRIINALKVLGLNELSLKVKVEEAKVGEEVI